MFKREISISPATSNSMYISENQEEGRTKSICNEIIEREIQTVNFVFIPEEEREI